MFANLRLFWDSSEVWWGLRDKLGCGQGPGPITVGGPLDALFQSTSGLEWEYHLSANVQVPCLISKTTSGKSLNLFFFFFFSHFLHLKCGNDAICSTGLF